MLVWTRQIKFLLYEMVMFGLFLCVIKHHIIKVCGRGTYGSSQSYVWHNLETRGHFCAPVTSSP